MDQELVSGWLQLSPGNWPPDHYTLLGLPSGESDLARIEQQVYQRMEIMRRYQLTYAEPATEVMNRLAQALVCLTDPVAKRSYDTALLPQSKRGQNGQKALAANSPVKPLAPRFEEAQPTETRGLEASSLIDRNEGDWQTAPPTAYPQWQTSAPPVRSAFSSPLPNAHRELIETVQQSMLREPAENTLEPALFEAPLQVDIPRAGPAADLVPGRLRDKRALYAHVTKMRRLLWAWEQAGRFLRHDPPRVINRPVDAMDLMADMRTIREVLEASPSELGNAGGPGYHIFTLARQQDVVPRLKKMTLAQRESVARDWQTGHDFLLEHRRALRDQLLEVRRRGLFGKVLHVLGAALMENVGLVILLISIVTINLAFQHNYPELRSLRFEQTMLFLALACSRLVLWWHSYAPLRAHLHVPRQLERTAARPPRRMAGQAQTSGTKA